MTATTATRSHRCWVLLAILAAGLVSAAAAATPAAAIEPQHYAADALDVMEGIGYYVDLATWPAQRAAAERAVRGAPDTTATHPALRIALAAAGGRHSRLLGPGERLSDLGPPPAPPAVRTGSAGVTTITVPRLVTDDLGERDRYAATLADGLHRAAPDTSCGWVVDLRGNTGGDMWPMVAGLTPLLPDGPALSFVARDGQRHTVEARGGAALLDGTEQAAVADAAPVREPGGAPVAVLQDGDTASSGEATLLALRGLPQVRTFGADSAGYSSANVTIPLPDGATMLLTTALFADRTGRLFGGMIPPDEPAADAAAAAATWLAQRCR